MRAISLRTGCEHPTLKHVQESGCKDWVSFPAGQNLALDAVSPACSAAFRSELPWCGSSLSGGGSAAWQAQVKTSGREAEYWANRPATVAFMAYILHCTIKQSHAAEVTSSHPNAMRLPTQMSTLSIARARLIGSSEIGILGNAKW